MHLVVALLLLCLLAATNTASGYKFGTKIRTNALFISQSIEEGQRYLKMKKLQFKLLDSGATVIRGKQSQSQNRRATETPVNVRVAKNFEVAKIVTLRVMVFYPEVRALAQFHNQILAKLFNRIRERGSILLIADRVGNEERDETDADLFGNDILGSVELSPEDFTNTAMENEASISTRKLYIADLAVCPTARRQGIAKKLLNAVESHAASHGYDELYLHVERQNFAAKQLYVDCMGYSEVPSANQWADQFTKQHLQKDPAGFYFLTKKIMKLNNYPAVDVAAVPVTEDFARSKIDAQSIDSVSSVRAVERPKVVQY